MLPEDQDPEIAEQEKKNKIWHLKFERWKEAIVFISFCLKNFKAEAVSLVAGLVTIILSWRQLQHYTNHVHRQETAIFEKPVVKNLGLIEKQMPTSIPAGAEVTIQLQDDVITVPWQDPGNYGLIASFVILAWGIIYVMRKRKHLPDIDKNNDGGDNV